MLGMWVTSVFCNYAAVRELRCWLIYTNGRKRFEVIFGSLWTPDWAFPNRSITALRLFSFSQHTRGHREPVFVIYGRKIYSEWWGIDDIRTKNKNRFLHWSVDFAMHAVMWVLRQTAPKCLPCYISCYISPNFYKFAPTLRLKPIQFNWYWNYSSSGIATRPDSYSKLARIFITFDYRVK